MKKTHPKRGESRVAIVGIVVLAIALGLAVWYLYCWHSRIGGIRNVVLISIDTCRADRLSCYGYKRQTTPNIDAIAREGVLFQNALTPAPMTTPAHSSMLTGTYPPTHGVHLNDGQRLGGFNVTLAEILRDAGYQTAAFVGGFSLDPRFGLNQGFDTYDCHYSKQGKKGFLSERKGEEVSRQVLHWLDEHSTKPFFLFVHYFDAHTPYEPPLPYSRGYATDLYAGEISYVDHCLGQVLDQLRELGAYENTLLIITGDHGESLDEHGEKTHSFFMYQSTLQVPLVIRAQGGNNGKRVEENVSLVDIVPTVLDLVGLKSSPQVQGESLRRYLEVSYRSDRGGSATDKLRQIYSESWMPATFGCSPLNGIVEGAWKYIRAPRQELYDLSRDAGEHTNVFEKNTQVARRLRGCLDAMLQQMESAVTQNIRSPVDPEAIKGLQSLGYVGGGVTPSVFAFDPTREDPKDFLPIFYRLQDPGECSEILKSRPELIAAHRTLFDTAVADNRLAEAKQHLTRIESLLTGPRDLTKRLPAAAADDTLLMCHINLGQAYQAEGKLAEAANEFSEALLVDPEQLDAHKYLALVLLGQGKFEEAIVSLRRVSELDPTSAEVHHNLGLALQQQGKIEDAIVQYRQAMEMDPQYAQSHNNLGVILRDQRKADEAIAHLQKALKINPDYDDAHYNLGLTLQRTGKLSEAIGHYEQALRINPDYAKKNPNLMPALEASREAFAAIERYDKALLTTPDDSEAHNNLGNVLRQVGRVPEAIGHYERALRIKPDFVEAHYNLALALEKTGKLPEAIVHYTEAVRLKPDLLPALNNLAWIRATAGDPSLRDGAAAVRMAEHAIQLTGRKQAGLLDTLAAAYAEAGRFTEAVATAEEAIALASSEKQGNIAAAIEAHLILYRAGKPVCENH